MKKVKRNMEIWDYLNLRDNRMWWDIVFMVWDKDKNQRYKVLVSQLERYIELFLIEMKSSLVPLLKNFHLLSY